MNYKTSIFVFLFVTTVYCSDTYQKLENSTLEKSPVVSLENFNWYCMGVSKDFFSSDKGYQSLQIVSATARVDKDNNGTITDVLKIEIYNPNNGEKHFTIIPVSKHEELLQALRAHDQKMSVQKSVTRRCCTIS